MRGEEFFGKTRRVKRAILPVSPRPRFPLSPGRLGALVIPLFLLLATGCSTFNYEWRREARKPAPTNDFVGAWEGSWISARNGHHGALRCLITRETNGAVNARFYATYKHILHFGYAVPLETRRTDNGVAFMGHADLGMLAGGTYRYAGYSTPTNFFSSYDSKYDHGTFQMLRP